MYSLKGLPQFAWIIIGVSVVVLLIGIFAYFKFRAKPASNFTPSKTPNSYLKLGAQTSNDSDDFSVIKDDVNNILGQEDDGVSFNTISVGGLYRRKPQRHKKKKQSLNKNKYKKQRKPRK